MPRISGIDVPNEKRIEIALTYVHGIGKTKANIILGKAKIDKDKRAKDLTDTDLASIQAAINEIKIPVEGELKRIISANIRRLQEIGTYRGLRHRVGLPARGQRTSHNARTKKGKRKTVGGQKKKIAKK